MNNILRRIAIILTSPLRQRLQFMLFSVVLLTVPNLLYWGAKPTGGTLSLSIVAIEILTVYLLTLPAYALGKYGRFIYFGFLCLLFTVFSFIDSVCLASQKAPFNKDFFTAMIHSNVAESAEFLSDNLGNGVFSVFSLAIFLAVAAFILGRYVRIRGRKMSLFVLFSLWVLCLTSICANHYGVFYTSIQKIRFVCIIRPIEDITMLINDPDIEVFSTPLADNIVFIVGESFNKDHSSLYGYKRNTNPLLSRLRDSGK